VTGEEVAQHFEGRPKGASAIWVFYRRYAMTHVITFLAFAALALLPASRGAWYPAVGAWGVACFILAFLTLPRLALELGPTDRGIRVASGRAGYLVRSGTPRNGGEPLLGATVTRDYGSIHSPVQRKFDEVVVYDARGATCLRAADTRVAYGAKRGVSRLDDLEAALVAAGAAKRNPPEPDAELQGRLAGAAVRARSEAGRKARRGLWVGAAIAASVVVPSAWLLLSPRALVPLAMVSGPYTEVSARLELAAVAGCVVWMALGRLMIGIPSGSILVGDRLYGDRLPFRTLRDPASVGEIKPEDVRRARVYQWGGDPEEGEPARYLYVLIEGARRRRASFYGTTLEGRAWVRKELAAPEEKPWRDGLFAQLLLASNEALSAAVWLRRHRVAVEEIDDSPDEIA
jgi:hypothetical protein